MLYVVIEEGMKACECDHSQPVGGVAKYILSLNQMLDRFVSEESLLLTNNSIERDKAHLVLHFMRSFAILLITEALEAGGRIVSAMVCSGYRPLNNEKPNLEMKVIKYIR